MVMKISQFNADLNLDFDETLNILITSFTLDKCIIMGNISKMERLQDLMILD